MFKKVLITVCFVGFALSASAGKREALMAIEKDAEEILGVGLYCTIGLTECAKQFLRMKTLLRMFSQKFNGVKTLVIVDELHMTSNAGCDGFMYVSVKESDEELKGRVAQEISSEYPTKCAELKEKLAKRFMIRFYIDKHHYQPELAIKDLEKTERALIPLATQLKDSVDVLFLSNMFIGVSASGDVWIDVNATEEKIREFVLSQL